MVGTQWKRLSRVLARFWWSAIERTDQGHYKGYTEDDLEKLLKILESVHGKFILSNYGSELLSEGDDNYAVRNGWEVREFDLRLSAPKKNGQRKREILVMNYKPDPKLF